MIDLFSFIKSIYLHIIALIIKINQFINQKSLRFKVNSFCQNTLRKFREINNSKSFEDILYEYHAFKFLIYKSK